MSVEEDRSGSSDSEDESEHLSSEDEGTVEVNGFRVLVSQENQVKEMFKDHPNLDSDFDIRNQQLRDAYMDVLLKLNEKLYHSTNVLSLKDFDKACNTHFDLTRAGFKVSWLRQRLDESYLKLEKKIISRARIKELEKLVKKRKLNLLNLESDLKKEKAAAEEEELAAAGEA